MLLGGGLKMGGSGGKGSTTPVWTWKGSRKRGRGFDLGATRPSAMFRNNGGRPGK